MDQFFTGRSSEQNAEIKDSLEYMLAEPPKRQAVVNDKMEWVAPPQYEGVEDCVKLTRYIRQVRNNLFHGGKFKGNYFSAQERSTLLIEHCMTIMHHLATSHDGLREAFEKAHHQGYRLVRR